MNMTNVLLSLAAAGAALGAMALADPGEASADPEGPLITFDQKDFPCEEDEVLGYSPDFGPDRVGCIHIELR